MAKHLPPEEHEFREKLRDQTKLMADLQAENEKMVLFNTDSAYDYLLFWKSKWRNALYIVFLYAVTSTS
jgi:hypothetical protein